MKSVVDDRFRTEAARFAFRFTCESCIHYDREQRACSNGFPCAPHREVDLARRGVVTFCKLFELE